MSVKSFEKGTITLPAYCGKPSMPLRKGTEPGTVDAESMPMMPSIAARPLRISHLRPRSFCSACVGCWSVRRVQQVVSLDASSTRGNAEKDAGAARCAWW